MNNPIIQFTGSFYQKTNIMRGPLLREEVPMHATGEALCLAPASPHEEGVDSA